MEAEVDMAVHCLLLNKAGRHAHLRAEQFMKWLRKAYPVEGTYTPQRQIYGGIW